MLDGDKIWNEIQNKVSGYDAEQMSTEDVVKKATYCGAIKAMYAMYEVLHNAGAFSKKIENIQYSTPVWERSMYGFDEPCIGESDGKTVLAMKGYSIDIDELFEMLPKKD